MGEFTKWIKQAVTSIVDPEKESRFSALVQKIQHDLFQKKQKFVLASSICGMEYRPRELELAKEQIFQTILTRAWNDGVLTEGERQVAAWAAKALELTRDQAKQLNFKFAREQFSIALAMAMDDGKIEPHEEHGLNQIAATVGLSTSDFARTFFRSESESFLRGIFSACIGDNNLSTEGWHNLIAAAARMGIAHDEMLLAIQPQAQRFVEHVLADAKSDGFLSNDEEAALKWMVENLGLPATQRKYVATELVNLRYVTRIRNGQLPSIPAPSEVVIRSGEIIHFHDHSAWRRAKVRQNTLTHEDFRGMLTLTDNRLIFTSVEHSKSTSYRSVISFQGGNGWFSVQTEGKPLATYFFKGDTEIPFLILQVALAASNQQIVVKIESEVSRHIPRDVRQRTWQRYGGRCAECNADDYLEFDHIIPVAKGGSNADANIQLLCRRCNLKKSDFI